MLKMLAAGGVWRMGRGESHSLVAPGFPLGPGNNKSPEMIMSQCTRLSSSDEICIRCINAAILIPVIYKFRGPRVLRLNQKAHCCLKLQYETMKINSFNSRLQT